MDNDMLLRLVAELPTCGKGCLLYSDDSDFDWCGEHEDCLLACVKGELPQSSEAK